MFKIQMMKVKIVKINWKKLIRIFDKNFKDNDYIVENYISENILSIPSKKWIFLKNNHFNVTYINVKQFKIGRESLNWMQI